MENRRRSRRFWLWAALLALAVLPCVACLGFGAWLSRSVPIGLEQVPERPVQVRWEDDLSPEEGLAWLQALVARDAPAEVWLGQMPPDISVTLPEQVRVVGGVRRVYPGHVDVRAWFRLPAEQDALDALRRSLARSGWREPVFARLLYRTLLPSTEGKPPGGFVPVDGSEPSRFFRLYCGPRPGYFLELYLRRDPDTDTLWGTLVLQDLTGGVPDMPPPPCTWLDTARFLAWAVRFPLSGLLGLGPGEALPGVVRLPRLTPPPGLRIEVSPMFPWSPERYLGHSWLWVPEGGYLNPQQVLEHYAAQMKAQGWKEVERRHDEHGFHTRWEKSSLLGRRWLVELSVLRHSPTQVSAWLYMRRADRPLEPERLFGPETSSQARQVTVHGQATPEVLRAWLEHWWDGPPGGMRKVQAMPGPVAPEPPIPVPEGWRLLGAVGTQWVPSPWAPPPISANRETLWVYQVEGTFEAWKERVAASLEAAGWQRAPWSNEAAFIRGFVLPYAGPNPQGDGGEWCRPSEEGGPTHRVHLMARPTADDALWVYVTAFQEPSPVPCPSPGGEKPVPEPPFPEAWLPTLLLPEDVRAVYGPPLIPMGGSSVWLADRDLDRAWEAVTRQMEEQGWKPKAEARSGAFRWSRWSRQQEGRTLRLYVFAWTPEKGVALLFLRWDPTAMPSTPGD